MTSLNKIFSHKREETDDWISVSDLMAVLMIIFMFIAIIMIKEAFEEAQRKERLEDHIYEALYEEFKDDLDDWAATIDRVKLSVNFNEPDVFFKIGDSTVQPRFRAILDDFYPRYIKVLRVYRQSIDEIRIEGHTSTQWGKWTDPVTKETRKPTVTEAYFLNMELSQARTRNVLKYCFAIKGNWAMDKSWTKSKITANGLSSSQLILDPETKEENPQKSQRVVFRVKADDLTIRDSLKNMILVSEGT